MRGRYRPGALKVGKPLTDKTRCSTCIYFSELIKGTVDGDGICRRYPPKVIWSLPSYTNSRSAFPAVYKDDGCYEWEDLNVDPDSAYRKRTED